MKNKLFEPFLEKLDDFPFWVKEIIYKKLREEFENAFLSEEDLETPITESFQAFKPMLTFIGKKELGIRSNEENENVYQFMKSLIDNSSIAEITLRNFWSLESTAKLMIYCIQKEYVSMPTSSNVYASALYISGRIKTGDYFRRIGKITIDQLDFALRKQKELDKQGKPVQFAEVMISLGYLTEQETKAIIYIKEECKKRFIFNTNILGNSATINTPDNVNVSNTKEKGEQTDKNDANLMLLRQEIYDLKTKLKEIQNIIKR